VYKVSEVPPEPKVMMVSLVSQALKETKALLASVVRKVNLDLLVFKESRVREALQVRKVLRVLKALLVFRDKLVFRVSKASKVLLVLVFKVLLVSKDYKVKQDHRDRLVLRVIKEPQG